MIIMWMHTFKYYRSSVRKKFWFSSKLINFPKTLISSSSQFFLAIEKVMHVYYKKAVVREYLILSIINYISRVFGMCISLYVNFNLKLHKSDKFNVVMW